MIASSPVDILAWLRTTNRSQILTPAERTVATEIASRIGSRSGTCYPSLQTIADSVGLCLSLVKRAIRKLIEMGLLAVRYTGRSNVYSLRGLPGCPSDGHDHRHNRTKISNEVLPPTPQESENQVEEALALKPGALSELESVSEIPVDTNASPEPENATESRREATDEIAALVAYFLTISGTKADSVRHRKALQQALKTNTTAQIEQAAKVAKATWSNPYWITPSAVCKPGRVDELLSQAKASAVPKAACHKPFEPEQPIQRAAPSTVAQHISALKAALAG